MAALGGLVLTAPAGLSGDFAHRAALSILHLLQLDKSPVALCAALHNEAAALSGNLSSGEWFTTATPCLVPLATKINVFTSCGAAQNTEPVETVLAAHEELRRRSSEEGGGVGLYEPWEARYLAATLAFSVFDFRRCAELCVEAVKAEPRDAFSARLLFISAFNCGQSAVMADAFADALSRLPSYDHTAAGVGDDPFAARPYYHALLAFGMNECGIGGTSAPRHHIEQALAQATAYNRRGFLGEASWIHPFAVHALCHVLAHTPLEGLRLLLGDNGSESDGAVCAAASEPEVPSALWATSPYFACHLYYHLITMYVDTAQTAKAIALYDGKLAPLVVIGDMYSVADASSIVGRFVMADMLPFGDARPVAAADMWVRAARANGASLHRVPFFMMNLVGAAVLAGGHKGDDGVSPAQRELTTIAGTVLLKTSEPFRSIFGAVLARDGALLGQTKAEWRSVGGSRGQIDLLERLRVWSIGLVSPQGAAAELLKAAVFAPNAPYYPQLAVKYATKSK